jgi:hypothetical protein
MPVARFFYSIDPNPFLRNFNLKTPAFYYTDRGVIRTDSSPSGNYFGDKGWHNNAIIVCPTDINIVLAGVASAFSIIVR